MDEPTADGGPTAGRAASAPGGAAETPRATALAERLLAAVRTDGRPGPEPEPILAELAAADERALAPIRTDRGRALAFWLNLYNAGTQLLLARRPGLYEGPLRLVRFFRATAVTVGGGELSLDAIEHGILRGSRSKYGLGYLPRLPRRAERRFRLAEPDPRVHFALNCGAESCPAIRAYEPGRIDDQLDLATRGYLDATVAYDPDAGVARLPRLFLWYRGDFGGGDGIRSFLRAHDAIPDGAAPRLRYRSWDWSKAAGKFADGA